MKKILMAVLIAVVLGLILSLLTGMGSSGFKDPKVVKIITTKDVNAMAGASPTVLYTVPTGKNFIITGAVFRDPTASLLNGNSYTVGPKSTINLASLTSTGAYYYYSAFTSSVFAYTTEGNTISFTVVTGSAANAHINIDLLGIEF